MVPTVLDVLGIEPPATIRGVTQSPLQGVSFAKSFDDAAAASDHHTQYFEMLGSRAIYHDGWRAVCPWPGPSFAEAGMGFGQPISADTLTELDATAWELYHVDEDFAENTERRGGQPRQAHRAHRHLVRGGRQVRRHARRRQRPAAHDRREAAGRGASRQLHVHPGHAVDAVLRRPTGAQPPAQHHGDRRDPRGRRRGRPALPGLGGRRVLALHEGRRAALRPQLRLPQSPRGVLPGARPGRRARTPLRVRADRRTGPRRRGEGRPDGCSSTSTGPSWPRRRRR